MCGIAGIADFSVADVDRATVRAMGDRIAHRGPDDQGQWFSKSVGLAHRRLSILDLSAAGHQPMVSDKACLIYNGEIYNSPELRSELRSAGHQFIGHSDTEVLLKAYEQWGYDCLDRLNGIFAFAIWDIAKATLFAVRDRFGIKPFYYHVAEKKLVFASEIKALLECPAVPRRPNLNIAYDYLVAGYLDHSLQTFFDRIVCLKPAHALTFASTGLRTWKYYDPCFNYSDFRMSDADAVLGFRDLFADSVKKQLLSDVPVAVNLSGGLDSSAVVCQIAKIVEPAKSGPIKTFSARFPDHPEDEGPFIDQVAAQVPLDQVPVYLKPKSLLDEIEAQVVRQDQPVMSAAMFAKGEVMRTVGEHGIKVVLEGQGADEVLCGYPNAGLHVIADALRQMRFRNAATEVRAAMTIYRQTARQVIGQSTDIAFPKVKALIARRPRVLWKPAEGNGACFWLSRDFAHDRTLTPDLADMDGACSLTDKYCLGGLQVRSLPFYLRSDDHNAMAYGVEARVPFLDHRLVDYVFSLPPRFRFRNGTSKWILRQAMAGIVPDSIRLYPGKRAFPTPQASWLVSDSQSVQSMLTSEAFRSCALFDAEGVKTLFTRIREGHNGGILWRVLNYFVWLQKFGFA
jgi:asparagine synthase (glutamine-hydrolysing)